MSSDKILYCKITLEKKCKEKRNSRDISKTSIYFKSVIFAYCIVNTLLPHNLKFEKNKIKFEEIAFTVQKILTENHHQEIKVNLDVERQFMVLVYCMHWYEGLYAAHSKLA